MIQKLKDTIAELKEEYYQVWEDVCNIESPTNYKQGVDAVGQYFANHAKKRGWQVEICPQEVSGDVVCITINPDLPQRPLSLSGHIDTVHPVGSFGSPAVRRDEERIYGPGVTDCKGGAVAGLMTLDALWRCGYNKRPVQLLLQTDEEVSSMQSNKSTIGYICKKAKDSIAFINLETYVPGRVCMQRKGSVSYRFHVVGKAGHSSRCVTEGANAIVDACHKMLELDRLKDDDGITCNCSTITGGTVENAIPEHCTFSINIRFASLKQYEWVENFIRKLAATEHVPGCHTTVEQISLRTCMEKTEQNWELMEKVNAIFREHGMMELNPAMLRGGSDAADTTAYGIPSLDSQGVQGKGSHTKNEQALLSSLEDAAIRCVTIATYLE